MGKGKKPTQPQSEKAPKKSDTTSTWDAFTVASKALKYTPTVIKTLAALTHGSPLSLADSIPQLASLLSTFSGGWKEAAEILLAVGKEALSGKQSLWSLLSPFGKDHKEIQGDPLRALRHVRSEMGKKKGKANRGRSGEPGTVGLGVITRTRPTTFNLTSDGTTGQARGIDFLVALGTAASTFAPGDVIATLLLYPSNFDGTNLQIESLRWEKYVVKKFFIHYEPVASTSSTGQVMIFMDPDPDDSLPAAGGGVEVLRVAESHDGCAQAQVWAPTTARYKVDPKMTDLFVDEASVDLRFSAFGRLYVLASSAIASGTPLGNLKMEFDVEFRVPNVAPPGDGGLDPASAFYTSTASAGAPLVSALVPYAPPFPPDSAGLTRYPGSSSAVTWAAEQGDIWLFFAGESGSNLTGANALISSYTFNGVTGSPLVSQTQLLNSTQTNISTAGLVFYIFTASGTMLVNLNPSVFVGASTMNVFTVRLQSGDVPGPVHRRKAKLLKQNFPKVGLWMALTPTASSRSENAKNACTEDPRGPTVPALPPLQEGLGLSAMISAMVRDAVRVSMDGMQEVDRLVGPTASRVPSLAPSAAANSNFVPVKTVNAPVGNHKGSLQEALMKCELPTPKYTTIVVAGEGTHEPKFKSIVKLRFATGSTQYSGGVFGDKSSAEQSAAFVALLDQPNWGVEIGPVVGLESSSRR